MIELKNHYPTIILIAGKARSGKSTIAKHLYNELSNKNKKVIISPYTKYLKQYITDITGNPLTEENKPRQLLQKLSSDLIKKKLGYNDLFINRQIEDIEIYSYFKDYIIIPDVRFPKEIEVIKDKFNDVISIGIKRKNYQSDLTKEEQQDITETALDNYKEYDIIIDNEKDTNLLNESLKIIKRIEERRNKHE